MEKTKSAVLKCVNFHAKAEPASDVYVSGSFNHWNGSAQKMTPATPGGTDYHIALVVPLGRHEYKFVVDGEYRIDPACPQWTINDFGTLNSVLDVR